MFAQGAKATGGEYSSSRAFSQLWVVLRMGRDKGARYQLNVQKGRAWHLPFQRQVAMEIKDKD